MESFTLMRWLLSCSLNTKNLNNMKYVRFEGNAPNFDE